MGERIEKKNIGRNIFIYPMPVTLVGAIVENRPNFMIIVDSLLGSSLGLNLI